MRNDGTLSLSGTLKAVAEAPPNIAFVKYWGKRDPGLNLPVADSISVCLDRFHTRVEFTGGEGVEGDSVWWNDALLGPPHLSRFARIFKWVRERAGRDFPVMARVTTSLPARVGLAGSAAAMAAAAGAAAALHGLEPSQRELSALARLGSGSASRSIPDGFVRWNSGSLADGSDSFAESLAEPGHWPELAIVVVMLDSRAKGVSSTKGMARCAQSSPDFEAWVAQCDRLSWRATKAISDRDFQELATVSRASAMSMHALCLTAHPPILYVTPETVKALELVAEMSARLPLFHTLDAGPNPILFTLDEHVDEVVGAVAGRLPEARLLECKPGPGVRVIDN